MNGFLRKFLFLSCSYFVMLNENFLDNLCFFSLMIIVVLLFTDLFIGFITFKVVWFIA